MLANGDVLLATDNAGSQSGTISFEDSIYWNSGSSLTLNAIRDIDVANGVAILNDGAGTLTLHADALGSGQGTVNIAGQVQSAGGTVILYNPASYSAPTDFSANVSGPYLAYMLVNSVTNLQSMAAAQTGAYALGTDIDGGNGASGLGSFNGTLNGFGHTLSDFTIDGGTSSAIGFFGTLGSKAMVENINFSNVSVSAASEGFGGGVPEGGVGIVAGINNGTILGVTTSGAVHSTGVDGRGFGGIAGINNGLIQNSVSNATVSGPTGYLAGLAGGNFGQIIHSGETGDVTDTANNDTIGGLVASNFGTIYQSYASGNVGGQSGIDIGGLVAVNYATVSQSFAVGDVTAGSSAGSGGTFNGTVAGGLVGWNYFGSVYDSYAVGDNLGATAQNIFAQSIVTGGSGAATGSVIGSNEGTLTNVYNAQGGSVANYGGFSGAVWANGTTIPQLQWQVAAGIVTGFVSGSSGTIVNPGGITGASTGISSGGSTTSASTGNTTSGSSTMSTGAPSPYLSAGTQSAGIGALSAGELGAVLGQSSNSQLTSTTFPTALLDQYAISLNEVYNPMAAAASDFALDLMVAQNGLAPGSVVFYTGVSSAGVEGISSGGVMGPSSAGLTGYSAAGASLADLPGQGGLTQGALAPGSIVWASNMDTYGPLVGSGQPFNASVIGSDDQPVDDGNGDMTLTYDPALAAGQLAQLQQVAAGEDPGVMYLNGNGDVSDDAAAASLDAADAANQAINDPATGTPTTAASRLTQASVQYEQAQQQAAANSDQGLSKTGQQKWMLNNLITMTNICVEQHTGGKAGEAYESRRDNRLIYTALQGLRNGPANPAPLTGMTRQQYEIMSVPPSQAQGPISADGPVAPPPSE